MNHQICSDSFPLLNNETASHELARMKYFAKLLHILLFIHTLSLSNSESSFSWLKKLVLLANYNWVVSLILIRCLITVTLYQIKAILCFLVLLTWLANKFSKPLFSNAILTEYLIFFTLCWTKQESYLMDSWILWTTIQKPLVYIFVFNMMMRLNMISLYFVICMWNFVILIVNS